MRVATVDGLVTLFYDGSKKLFNRELYDEWTSKACDNGFHRETAWEEWDLSDECKRYWKERDSWQQVIIEEGVTEIPEDTFCFCRNIERVIFANTVIRIRSCAFELCHSLVFIKLPLNLECIGRHAFSSCNKLISVFIPPRCRAIEEEAFSYSRNLEIFNVPQQTRLDKNVIAGVKLLEESHFELEKYDITVDGDDWLKNGCYDDQTDEVHDWLKNINSDEKYSLHRACCSFQPLKEVLMTIILQQGIGAFNIKNEAGITPSRYLKENPYADIKETDIIRGYVMKMTGEYES